MKTSKTLLTGLLVIILSLLTGAGNLFSQNVAISDDEGHTADPSAMLDVKSITKGMLVPRMPTSQREAIPTPATGLLVFDETELSFFFFNGTVWISLSSEGVWDSSGSDVFLADPASSLGVGTHEPFGKLEVKGDASIGINDPIFEVINANGDTVFAVYPEGVRIMVSEGDTKGAKGGFAIGGFGSVEKSGSEFFRVTPDSIRMYLDDTGGKGAKGGFAIGGIAGTEKGSGQEFLMVTPDSVRVYFNEDKTKGAKGGFAVGGFSSTTVKGATNEFLSITPDTAKFNIVEEGRFLINQYGAGTSDNLINLTKDNYFIGHQAGINTTPIPLSGQGRNNSFIGYQSGLTNTTGSSNIFLGYQSGYGNEDGFDNIFFGNQAGFTNTTGDRNIFLGDRAGYFNVDGYQNIFLGALSGYKNTSGNDNTFLGYQAGQGNEEGNDNVYIGYRSGYISGTYTPSTVTYKNIRNVFIGHSSGYNTAGVSGSVFIGYQAGLENTTANYNIFIGNETGKDNTTGASNTFIGTKCGWKNQTGGYNAYLGASSGSADVHGAYNAFVGYATGFKIDHGYANVFLGSQVGYEKLDGDFNVMIGWKSGYNSGTSAGNVFIGRESGYNETGSNLLYIENSNSSTPLIWGDFSADSVVINGDFNVIGDAYCTGNDWSSSDVRLKSDISGYNNALAQVMDLRAVRYNWNREEYADMNFSSGPQIGVIAQELEEVIPELVNTRSGGYKSVDYARLSAVLLEAVKEQQAIIEDLDRKVSLMDDFALQIEELQKKLSVQEDRINSMEATIK